MTIKGTYGPGGQEEKQQDKTHSFHDTLRKTDRTDQNGGVARKETRIDYHISTDPNGALHGNEYAHGWTNFEDGRVWDSVLQYGDPFGVVHHQDFYNGQPLTPYDIVNGTPDPAQIARWQRKGSAPPPSGISAIFAGLEFGVANVTNAGVKFATFGLVHFAIGRRFPGKRGTIN